MTSKMVLHCGGYEATLDELKAVPLPEETKTYKPVCHYDLVCNIQRVAREMLHEQEFHKGSYALSKDGQRLFGLLIYQSDPPTPATDQADAPEMGLSIAFRNSYDKSCAVGLAVGGNVFICDNLALTGEITILRKHTQNVIEDLELAILRVVYKAQTHFVKLVQSAQQLKAAPLADDDAFRQLGWCFGRGILTPRQLTVAKREWLKPSYDAFGPRNHWSFYNAVTTALKSAPPGKILDRHLQLHDLMRQTLLG